MKTLANLDELHQVPESDRHIGLKVKVSSENTIYQLVNGVTNLDWRALPAQDNKQLVSTQDVDPVIENQYSSAQESADFWIDGTGRANLLISDSVPENPTEVVRLTDLSAYLPATKQSINTTVAGLRALTAPDPTALYQTTDFGTGNWYYDPADTTSIDNTGTVVVSTAGNRFKRIFTDVIKAEWFIVVGSPDDSLLLNPVLNDMLPGQILDFGTSTYTLKTALIIPNTASLTLIGQGAILTGELTVGIAAATAGFDYNLTIDGLRFSFGSLAAGNSITLVNCYDVKIVNCTFKNSDKAIYVAPKSYLHCARVQVSGCNVELDYSRDACCANRGANYFVYIDNVVNPGSQNFPQGITNVVADFDIHSNLDIQTNIAQVVGFGVDGLKLIGNTFFGSAGSYKSKIKTQNIYIVSGTWITISSNHIFEAGYEAVYLELVTNGIINDNQIAWPGQRDVTQGYGILISGGGQPVQSGYSVITISNNIIELPTRSGIKIDAGCNYVNVNSNVIVAPGNVSIYYGDGKYDQGNPNNTPLINSVNHYAIENDPSNLENLFTNNQCNEADYLFPISDSVSEYKKSRHFNNLGTEGYLEAYGSVITTITGNTIDASNVSNIAFNVTAGGTISTITGAQIGQRIVLYNSSGTITLSYNSSSMKLAGAADATIPFRGTLVLERQFGCWLEVSRTFLFTAQISDLHTISSPFELFYSTSGALNSPVSGYANGLQTSINNDTNYKNLLVMAGSDKLFYQTEAAGVWGVYNRIKFFSRYSTYLTSGVPYYPSYYDEVIDCSASNLNLVLASDSNTTAGVTKIFRNISATTWTITPNTGVTINGVSTAVSIPAGYQFTMFCTINGMTGAVNWLIISLAPLNTVAANYLSNPMTTSGDLIYSTTGGVPVRLPVGAEGQLLSVSGGAPIWINAPQPIQIHGSFSATVISATTVMVTIGSTMSNITYFTSLTPKNLLTAVSFYISEQTVTDFTVTFLTALTGEINFDWFINP